MDIQSTPASLMVDSGGLLDNRLPSRIVVVLL